MSENRTYQEINAKIRKGDAVVLTAEEFKRVVDEKGPEAAAREADVVTTGTFGAMCSSGAFLNFGHSDPPIRMKKLLLNGIPAYVGVAAVDAYIGATASAEEDRTYRYGGGHVIEDIAKGEDIHLQATAHGSDCYPRKEIDTYVSIDELNQAYLYNPRNAYQNYAVAVNSCDRELKTYMGTLKPRYGNANYATSGELSPLLNDPTFKTIGIGTSIWLAGARGHVAWEGTQFNVNAPRSQNGTTRRPGGTIAVAGNLKEMNVKFLKGMTFPGYGSSLGVGLGIPIPVLNADVARALAVRNRDIYTAVFDYSQETRARTPVCEVNYEQLQSGAIEVAGRTVKTANLSDVRRARTITEELKKLVASGEFALNEPFRTLPIEKEFKPLNVRGPKKK